VLISLISRKLVYIPVDASNGEDNLSLFAMVGASNFVFPGAILPGLPINQPQGNYNYTWNVKIEQIDCTGNNWKEGNEWVVMSSND